MGWQILCLKMIAVVLICCFGLLYAYFSPTYANDIIYNGHEIKIARDSYNIPTIILKQHNHQAYLYGIGYVSAQDRLFQMAFKIMLFEGRLAQHLGEKLLPIDRLMREINLKYWGERTSERLKRQNYSEYLNMKSYVDGINDAAANYPILPIDFHLIKLKWREYTVADIFSMVKLIDWSQSINGLQEYIKSSLLNYYSLDQVKDYFSTLKQDWIKQDSQTIIKDEEIPQGLLTKNLKKQGKFNQPYKPFEKQFSVEDALDLGIHMYVESGRGSNSWVISGEHTDSGHPIIANDPHLDNQVPTAWYQYRVQTFKDNHKITFESTILVGACFGVGKLPYITIAMTTIYTDNQDLYRQTINETHYFVNNKWYPLLIRNQTIKFKRDSDIHSQNYQIKSTFRGPLISLVAGSSGAYKVTDNISLVWTGFHDQYKQITDAMHLYEIRHFQQLKSKIAQVSYYLPNFAFLFSTQDGHIGVHQCGLFPLRKNIDDGQFIKDGSNTEHDWLGFIPSEDKLLLTDPQRGYIVTANNKIASESYYYNYFQKSFFTARSDRIQQLINSKIAAGQKITMSYVRQMQQDTIDLYCLKILPQLLLVLPQSKLSLSDFACNFSQNSHQATIYEVFFYQLYQLVKPKHPQNYSLLSFHTVYQYLYRFIIKAENSHKIETIQKAWANMKLNLESFFQSKDQYKWLWKDYHLDSMTHLPFGVSQNLLLKKLYNFHSGGDGNLNTVKVGKMNKVGRGDFSSDHHGNIRLLMSHWQKSYWIIDSGSSELFHSKHYNDQYQILAREEYLEMESKIGEDTDL